MKLHTGILVSLILVGSTAYAQKRHKQLGLKEKEISRAYNNYWSTPVENWSNIIRQQNISTYSIVKGDTLSELSTVLFGNESYWTKMWATNPYIKNPHLIYETDQIHFISGAAKRNAAPIVGYEVDHAASSRKELIAFSVDEDTIKIPEPMRFPPVISQLPGSFPSWLPKAAAKDGGIMAIERDDSALRRAEMDFLLESFVSDRSLDVRGVVRNFRNVMSNTGSTYGRLYVEARGEGLEMGQVYTVAERRGTIETSLGIKYPGAYLYENLGEAVVRRKINDRVFEIEVTSSTGLVGRGAVLLPGKISRYDLDFNIANIKEVAATILRGNSLFGHHIYNIGQVVYLSKGYNDGVETGDVVRINEERHLRNNLFFDVDVKNPVGIVKVVKSTPSFSTGVVVSLADFMIPGDKTHR